MLLHGLWSSAFQGWNLTIQNDITGRFVTHTHNYRSTHADSFLDNVIRARDGVRATVRKMRHFDGGFAATQADVVAHSMGGLLARLYIADFDDVGYSRPDNYDAGDVNRLITINTPHLGSPAANALLNVANVDDPNIAIQWTLFWNDVLQKNITSGAVFDLQTDSPIILELPAAAVPAHAITGTGLSDALEVPASDDEWGLRVKILQTANRLFGIPPEMIFADEHDGLVSLFSQRGGLQGTHTTNIPFDPLLNKMGFHNTVTDSIQDPCVDEKVIELLNTPVGNTSAFASGFPSNAPLEYVLGGLPDYGGLVDGIVLLSPSDGVVVSPGDIVDVTVNAIDGFVPEVWAALCSVDASLVTEPVFSTSLSIPVEMVGAIELNVGAFDSDWNLAVGEAVTLHVEVPAPLNSIEFASERYSLTTSFGISAPTTVLGLYDDGVTRDVTTLPEVSYSTFDSEVVTIDSQGVLTPVAEGVTVVQATHSGFPFPATVQVIVEAAACFGDTDGNGAIDVQDLITVILGWGECPAQPCDADIDNDGMVNVLDLIQVTLNWGPCPGSPAQAGETIEEVWEGAGLLYPEEWDLFMSNLGDENYRCWTDHHLNGGCLPTWPSCQANCPDDDPYVTGLH